MNTREEILVFESKSQSKLGAVLECGFHLKLTEQRSKHVKTIESDEEKVQVFTSNEE